MLRLGAETHWYQFLFTDGTNSAWTIADWHHLSGRHIRGRTNPEYLFRQKGEGEKKKIKDKLEVLG